MINAELISMLEDLQNRVSRLEVLESVDDSILALDADVVHKTGNETIAGIKTLTSSPIVPTPTTDYQASTKKYVDDEVGDVLQFVPLVSQLTSTSWDGDAKSTTSKTLLDLSSVFGVPAGVKAVLAVVAVRDSGSLANDCWLCLSPNNSAYSGPKAGCGGLANNKWSYEEFVVPCNVDGDIYYQISASGSLTLDVYLEIWGYWL